MMGRKEPRGTGSERRDYPCTQDLPAAKCTMNPALSKLLLLLLLLKLASPACSFSIQRPFSSPRPRQQPRQRRRLHRRGVGPHRRRTGTHAKASLFQLNAQRNREQQLAEGVRIREATADDAGAARQVLLRHAMNPLFVSENNLLVATATTTTTTIRSPQAASAGDKGGGGNVEEKKNEEEERVIGFGHIRPLPQDEKDGDGGGEGEGTAESDENQRSASVSFWELASLFVDTDHRRKGVGTAIIQELLRRHDEQHGVALGKTETAVLLLTLAPTAPLYEPHGFRVVDSSTSEFQKLPKSVRLEHAAGKAVSWVLGNELVCMVRR
jgi:GNAT superfamily N-acetyltransferase